MPADRITVAPGNAWHRPPVEAADDLRVEHYLCAVCRHLKIRRLSPGTVSVSSPICEECRESASHAQ